ncbi:hypothetical protein AK812_SmicGene12874 [Symbiodinium microadriaticum]|uniref:Uncharacterized protein n=1 Tax=Symbiodinium microadriaticum TaxID=2951 RepID=A0A1Q9E9J8_SYMMI|nr:hypothetical protein AK812_SmicGene12874 [Symbiodinium microadriaticum]
MGRSGSRPDHPRHDRDTYADLGDLGIIEEYDIHKRRAEMQEMHPRRGPRIPATAPNSTADTYHHRGQIDGLYYQGNDKGVYNPIHQKNADDLYYQGTTKAGPNKATTAPGTKLILQQQQLGQRSASQSLAQPVSPGPWGPQDEEFEQEAWTSILGYVPGRDQEPRGAEGDHQTKATGLPPAARPPPPKAHAATNLATPTRGVLRGLSPLAAGAARAVPAATPVPVKLGDDTDYQKAAPKGSEHEARQMHNNAELIETIRDNHNNSDDYLHAQGLVFTAQPPPTLLVPPGGPMPPHRGLHPNHDAFEDAYPTDEDVAEEPDWSRDSQDEADEEKGDDTTNLDKPGPSYGTRGSERPAEPVGAPPARPGSREDLIAEETRTERNRRARAEWRQWRRQQRRRGGGVLVSVAWGVHGIEYHTSGRCELWTRQDGIGTTMALAGYTCLRYVPALA